MKLYQTGEECTHPSWHDFYEQAIGKFWSRKLGDLRPDVWWHLQSLPYKCPETKFTLKRRSQAKSFLLDCIFLKCLPTHLHTGAYGLLKLWASCFIIKTFALYNTYNTYFKNRHKRTQLLPISLFDNISLSLSLSSLFLSGSLSLYLSIYRSRSVSLSLSSTCVCVCAHVLPVCILVHHLLEGSGYG